MEEQFTQGDWSVSYETLVKIGDINYNIKNPHDAHLFAASKKMYRLLETLLNLYPKSPHIHNLIIALLAEARGEK